MTTTDLAVPPSPPGGDRAIQRAGDSRGGGVRRDAAGKSSFAQLVKGMSGSPAASPGDDPKVSAEERKADGSKADGLPTAPQAAGTGSDLAALLANALVPGSGSLSAAPPSAGASQPLPANQADPSGAGAASAVSQPQAGVGSLPLSATGDSASTAGAGLRPVQVQVVARETHFAPAGTSSLPASSPLVAASPDQTEAEARSGLATPAPSGSIPPSPGEAGTKSVSPSPTSSSRGEEDTSASNAIQPVQTSLKPEGGEARSQGGGTNHPSLALEPRAAPAASSPTDSQDPRGGFAAVPGQVANAIQDEADRVAVAHGPSEAAAPAVAEGVLRVLKIELRPADLGLVTVEMRLKDGRLEASLRASRPETADYLRDSSSAITDLLSRAGYRAELAILDRGRSPSGSAPSPAGHLPSQSFEGDRSGGGGARRQPTERGSEGRAEPGDRRVNATDAHHDRGGSRNLYI